MPRSKQIKPKLLTVFVPPTGQTGTITASTQVLPVKSSETCDTKSSDTGKSCESKSSDTSTSCDLSITTIEQSKSCDTKSSSTDTESSWTSVSSDGSSVSECTTTTSTSCQTTTSCDDDSTCKSKCKSKDCCVFKILEVKCGGDYCVKKERLILISASSPASITLPCCQVFGHGKWIKILISTPLVCHGLKSADNIQGRAGTFFIGSKMSSYELWSTPLGWSSGWTIN